jgi:pyrroloquinoline quinone (PQQ) biosynthesis protein C
MFERNARWDRLGSARVLGLDRLGTLGRADTGLISFPGTPLPRISRPTIGARRGDGYGKYLEAKALAHAALEHPWLEAMESRRYPHMVSAVRDFAREYNAYSSSFPLYLRLVIDKLHRPEHRAALEENLREERGHMDASDRAALSESGLDPDEVEGIPHPLLFRSFCYSLGLDDDDLATPSPKALQWRDELLDFLRQASPAAALGALGPGTEYIVKPIYATILDALSSLPESIKVDPRFFLLHCTLDDKHADDLRNVGRAFMRNEEDRREMRDGMLFALRLRESFFTHLHGRASSRAWSRKS